MGSSNRPKTSGKRSISTVQLTRQMSDVISLREKVAQAELAAHVYGRTPDQDARKAQPRPSRVIEGKAGAVASPRDQREKHGPAAIV